MSRVITFSLDFPAKHPRRDQSTFFVEKVLNSCDIDYEGNDYYDTLEKLNPNIKPPVLRNFWGNVSSDQYDEKHHTIRAGNRWKVGDKFSPRVWSGKPYASKQIQFAADIEIKKIYRFHISGGEYKIDEKVYGGYSESDFELLELIGKNDGLNRHDLMDWLHYPKPFTGQIICWNENINY